MTEHGPHCETCMCGCTCGYGGQHEPNNVLCELNDKAYWSPDAMAARLDRVAGVEREGYQQGFYDASRGNVSRYKEL